MTEPMGLTVAVIAKECIPGKVKTRLTPPLRPDEAAELAQLSLNSTMAAVRNLPTFERLLVMDGNPEATDVKDFTVVPQASGGLDDRLAAVCDIATGPLLIVGMDTPQFSTGDVALLIQDWDSTPEGHDAWIGPATDGGFWALGLRRPDGALIRGVPMSTDTTGAEQLARLARAGLSVGVLPELRDMDYFSDALKIAVEIPDSDFACAVFNVAARNGDTSSSTGALR